MTHEGSALVSDRWPRLAAELAGALREADEDDLAGQVAGLRIFQRCDCRDAFCQSFYTQPPPDGAYGPDHRNVGLSPDRSGMLVLDVVDNLIAYVEVIDWLPLS
ncbi:hypothetical protein [Micromonospora sp. NBS 11-29]|uniref:hypothetical protein n=1 Tax=Micromonospora sp. NBS 11-29 TaxID=1960879 RepID=UPI000B7924CD|nr:hypothetical protein [Micromonospora sp. NBS 11-29]